MTVSIDMTQLISFLNGRCCQGNPSLKQIFNPTPPHCCHSLWHESRRHTAGQWQKEAARRQRNSLRHSSRSCHENARLCLCQPHAPATDSVMPTDEALPPSASPGETTQEFRNAHTHIWPRICALFDYFEGFVTKRDPEKWLDIRFLSWVEVFPAKTGSLVGHICACLCMYVCMHLSVCLSVCLSSYNSVINFQCAYLTILYFLTSKKYF